MLPPLLGFLPFYSWADEVVQRICSRRPFCSEPARPRRLSTTVLGHCRLQPTGSTPSRRHYNANTAFRPLLKSAEVSGNDAPQGMWRSQLVRG
jgi:hypothetical protein